MLTPRQAEALAFIRRFQEAQPGVAPTFSEIADGLGLASRSSASRLLDGLEERGFIRRLPNRARCIEIVDRSPLAHVSTEDLRAELERRGFFS